METDRNGTKGWDTAAALWEACHRKCINQDGGTLYRFIWLAGGVLCPSWPNDGNPISLDAPPRTPERTMSYSKEPPMTISERIRGMKPKSDILLPKANLGSVRTLLTRFGGREKYTCAREGRNIRIWRLA